MSRYADQIRDEFNRAVPGARVYVYGYDELTGVGALETLTADDASPLVNPLTTDEFGEFYFNADDGQKQLAIHFGGAVRWKELTRVGPPPVGLTGPAGDVAKVATRTELAEIVLPAAGVARYLTEAGREGLVIFDSTDLSASVTADTAQGHYVPPAADTTGASGAWVRADVPFYRPEQFGAIGDGVTNDATAFSNLLTTANSLGVPIRLKRGATYGLGVAAWTGLTKTLTKSLDIDGNGATIKVLVAPSQGPINGAGLVLLKFDGTASKFKLTVRDAKFDLGGFKVFALSPYRCDLDVQGCSFTNGDHAAGGTGNSSIAVNANACSGLIQGNSCKNVGYFVYLGHTDADYYSDGLRIIGNRAEQHYNPATPTVRGDFAVGVLKNGAIANNTISGSYAAVALAGMAATAMISENITITGNTISDCTGHGVQADVIGATKIRNVTITGNTMKTGGVNASGVYLVNFEKFVVADNDIQAFEYGLSIDNATNGIVENNRIDGTNATTKRTGVLLSTQIGNVNGLKVSNNLVTNYTGATGIALSSSAGFTASRISFDGNQALDNATGIAILDSTATDLALRGNMAKGNATMDLRCDALDCVIGDDNAYDTEQSIQYFAFTNLDTTPSVAGRKHFAAANNAATTITSLLNGVSGQSIVIYATNANTTIAHGGIHDFPGGADITLAGGEFITLRHNNGIWRVESRR